MPPPLVPPRRILVTGARGNLGRKIVAALTETSWCESVIGIDRSGAVTPEFDGRVRYVVADLQDARDRRWRAALEQSDAVVHLAATNPAPDARWEDACASFDITALLVKAAAAAGIRRFVFASSNHVMGQYKDSPLADGLEPGGLSTSLPPAPGTRWFNGREVVQGTAYAVSKLMGERVCTMAAELSGGAFTSVSVRIGWCQPGDNRPETITANGIAGEDAPTDYPGSTRDLRWFRDMWLSNRDYCAVMQQALIADPIGWPSPGIVVNGMSANSGMSWDVEETRRLIGYVPRDDIREHLR
jgi:nucleoside-diphosphate-sugar epimerase